jgi:tRNA A-37 threonylcarbamoyl transferase component Bud32
MMHRLETIDQRTIADCIERFERAWRKDGPADLASVLPPLARNERLAPADVGLLRELIKVDLEYRWKQHADPIYQPEARLLDDYVARFPELGPLYNLPVDLIAEEFRVRHRWGDRPTVDDMLRRFPAHREELARKLADVKAELLGEGLSLPVRPLPGTQAPGRDEARKIAFDFDPRAPLTYADFLLERFLGAGGMGKVYRARQRSLDKPVAVKVLRKAYLRQPEAVERFLDEARLLARLRHPNIVGVHGLGRTRQRGYFIVMDLVDGLDLAQWLANSAQPLAIDRAVDWVADVARAIEHAHQQGVLHCDLKPANVLLAGNALPIVTDFGLARPLELERPAGGDLAGTLAFMAPEQIDEYWGPIGPRTDVYGLGALLYSLLAGRPPFVGGSFDELIVRRATHPEPAPITELRADVPPTVALICQRCLAPDPRQRYASAAEAAGALRAEYTGR